MKKSSITILGGILCICLLYTALRAKYKSVTDDFSNKKKSGYFRNDVLAIINQFVAADPNAADAYMLSLMT